MGGRGRRYFARHYALDLAAGVIVETVEMLTERSYEFPEPPNPDLIPRGYEVVGTVWDGERTPYYPLMPSDRAWVLVSRDGDTIGDNPLDGSHNFGMETPTLSWQNGSQRIELYVDGIPGWGIGRQNHTPPETLHHSTKSGYCQTWTKRGRKSGTGRAFRGRFLIVGQKYPVRKVKNSNVEPGMIAS